MNNEYDVLVIGEAALLMWAAVARGESSPIILPCIFVMAVRATLAAEGMKHHE